MPPYGSFVEFEARPGKEDDVEQFLGEAKLMVDAEPGTLAWSRFGPGRLRFASSTRLTPRMIGRRTSKKVREAIIARADELFAAPPVITPVDVLASKLPAVATHGRN